MLSSTKISNTSSSSNIFYALIDCNNFFVSCERIFNPKLQNVPIAILSNNDGCIVARSNEIKAMNIPMGAPYFKHKQTLLKNNVVVLSSNFELYGNISSRFISILRMHSNKVEPYSVDEAFVKLSMRSTDCRKDIQTFAKSLHEDITKKIAIPTTIGIGTSKVLAKMACNTAKKEKSAIKILITPLEIQQLAEKTSVEKLWGISSRYKKRLNALGLYNAWELASSNVYTLKKNFGVNMVVIKKELNGIACINLNKEKKKKKSILSTRSFSTRLTQKVDVYKAVSHHAAKVAQKLRAQQSTTQKIAVLLETSRHTEKKHFAFESIILPVPSNDTVTLTKVAKTALNKAFKNGYAYKRAGFFCVVSTEGSGQAHLFIKPLVAENPKLMHTLDAINLKMGKGTLRLASEGFSKGKLRSIWQMKRNLCSPHYVTSFNDLPVVR